MEESYFTITHKGLVRSTNEDSLFAEPPVFMVADGMGGAQAGEVASAVAADAFSGFDSAGAEAEKSLAALVAEINSRIHEMATDDAERAGMGTTVTAAMVSGQGVAIAHVGDSRAYVWRDGKLEQLTRDHSLVGEMLRQGRISEAEAEIHPQRSIITRALGIEADVEVDTAVFSWKPGDIFLLCSDGLSSMVPDTEIVSILEGSENLAAAGTALVEAANTHGGRDNITAVLFAPDRVAAGAAGIESPQEADTDEMPAPGSAASAEPSSRLSRCKGKILIAAIAGLLLLGGAWLANSSVYYVGVEGDYIAVYRGVPLEIGPLSFSSVYSVSGVLVEDLEPFEQERVERHELKSRTGAEQVVENYGARVEEQRLQEQGQAGRTPGTETTPSTTMPAAGGVSTGGGA